MRDVERLLEPPAALEGIAKMTHAHVVVLWYDQQDPEPERVWYSVLDTMTGAREISFGLRWDDLARTRMIIAATHKSRCPGRDQERPE